MFCVMISETVKTVGFMSELDLDQIKSKYIDYSSERQDFSSTRYM